MKNLLLLFPLLALVACQQHSTCTDESQAAIDQAAALETDKEYLCAALLEIASSGAIFYVGDLNFSTQQGNIENVPELMDECTKNLQGYVQIVSERKSYVELVGTGGEETGTTG